MNFSKHKTISLSVRSKWVAILLVVVIFCLRVQAQSLDEISKESFLKVSGSIATNQTAYFASGISDRRDPYNYFISGSLNFDLYGWTVPLGFTYSNQSKGAFQQPFNQYGLTPTYKWITAHVGYSSMSFSSYTLNGHLFNGIGIDLAPAGNFKLSAMYGRLQKAVKADTLNSSGQILEPAYKRRGYGLKASYSKNKDNIDLIIFKAKDDLNSNPTLPSNGIITPLDNLVTGLNIGKVFLKHILFSGEFALSALTRDQRAIKYSTGKTPVPSLGFLLHQNSSTALYTAYKISLTYSVGKYVIGAGYERVAPEYQTLGAYYFSNDFENLTGNLTTKLLGDKMSLALNAGVQKNDLRKDKQSSMKRFVGSASLSYQASTKLNFNATYSNFQSFVNIKPSFNQINELTPYDNLDTLNYTQISQNINLNSNYILSRNKEKSQLLNINVSYMTSNDKQEGITQNTGGVFYNFNTSYNISWIPKNLSLTGSISLNRNEVGFIKSSTFGPTIGINKSFFDKKLRSSFSASLNRSYANGNLNSEVANFRLSNSYIIKKKHNLNLSMVALNRGSSSVKLIQNQKFTEFTTTLGYNYSF
jgi:hypothetical protein